MKALNRKEALVNAKANGTLNSFKPLTREEAFTKKALGLGGDSGGGTKWLRTVYLPADDRFTFYRYWDGITHPDMEHFKVEGSDYTLCKVSDNVPEPESLVKGGTIVSNIIDHREQKAHFSFSIDASIQGYVEGGNSTAIFIYGMSENGQFYDKEPMVALMYEGNSEGVSPGVYFAAEFNNRIKELSGVAVSAFVIGWADVSPAIVDFVDHNRVYTFEEIEEMVYKGVNVVVVTRPENLASDVLSYCSRVQPTEICFEPISNIWVSGWLRISRGNYVDINFEAP